MDSDELLLLVKGADDMILPRLAPSAGATNGSYYVAATLAAIEGFADAGRRTLLVAGRTVSSDEYARWRGRLEAAKCEVGPGRAAALAAAYSQLEQGLVLLGATAIEDQLQVGP